MEGKTICLNKMAGHEYFILERIETGIVLEGSEVKSLRLGNVNLKDSFCAIIKGDYSCGMFLWYWCSFYIYIQLYHGICDSGCAS